MLKGLGRNEKISDFIIHSLESDRKIQLAVFLKQ